MLTDNLEINMDILRFSINQINEKMGTEFVLQHDNEDDSDRFFYLSVGDFQITETFWDAQEMYAYLEGIKKGLELGLAGVRYDG